MFCYRIFFALSSETEEKASVNREINDLQQLFCFFSRVMHILICRSTLRKGGKGYVEQMHCNARTALFNRNRKLNLQLDANPLLKLRSQFSESESELIRIGLSCARSKAALAVSVRAANQAEKRAWQNFQVQVAVSGRSLPPCQPTFPCLLTVFL